MWEIGLEEKKHEMFLRCFFVVAATWVKAGSKPYFGAAGRGSEVFLMVLLSLQDHKSTVSLIYPKLRNFDPTLTQL